MKGKKLAEKIRNRFEKESDKRAFEDLLDKKTEQLWTPASQPQLQAYVSQADELLYGGAAGGGKSDLLLGLAMTAHKHSIIFRREFTQLSGASGLIERSRELLEEVASYNSHEHTWRGIPGGRSLEFGAVQHEKDVRKYMGRPHDLIGFDEITQLSEKMYRFLSGWNRTTDPNQRTRIVAAGNPPHTVEGRWVINYWGPWLDRKHGNPAEPGELRWFATVGGEDTEVDGPEPVTFEGEEILPRSRTFIPAKVGDNPYLQDTDYVQVLHGLPEPLRSQLLYGDFTAGVRDDPWQVIPTDWVEAAMDRWKEAEEPDEPIDQIGVDVARGGQDSTAIAYKKGAWVGEIKTYPGSSTPDGQAGATVVAKVVGDNKDVRINVDCIGVGGAVLDILRGQNYDVRGINASEESYARDRSGKLKIRNIRAEMYWKLREMLDPSGGEDLALPPDSELLEELVSPKWRLSVGGIIVEDKNKIRDRLGRSPNKSDALCLCLFPRRQYFF